MKLKMVRFRGDKHELWIKLRGDKTACGLGGINMRFKMVRFNNFYPQ